MKYLKHFESYEQVEKSEKIPNNDISVEETRKLHGKFLEYILKLSDAEKLKLKSDLEKFASDNNVTLDEMQNPKLVEELLKSKLNEGFGDWVKKNWYNIVDKLAKYTGIAALITFLGSMGLYATMGYETLDGVKFSAAAWLISQAVGALRGLK